MIYNGTTLLPIVALHVTGRASEPPSVFICVADIIAVVPNGARSQVCVRGIPAPASVDESAFEVIAKIHAACGVEMEEHLREGRADAALDLSGGES
jgi:hypothetical protein